MIAIVGLPGSQHHRAAWFPTRKEAEDWSTEVWLETMRQNPALGSLQCRVISDRAASRIKWQDGTKIYTDLIPSHKDYDPSVQLMYEPDPYTYTKDF